MPEPKRPRRSELESTPPLRNIEELSRALAPTPVTVPLRSDFPAPFPTGAPMLSTGSAAVYHELRASMRPAAFKHYEETPFPVALINESTAKGQIQLRPPMVDDFPAFTSTDLEGWAVEMWKHVDDLSPRDADVLDALCHLWMQQARTPDAKATVEIDALLELRGIQPKKGGTGRRGGYMPEQRCEIVSALVRIQNVWLSLTELETYEATGTGKGRRKATRRGITSRAFTFSTFLGQVRLDGSMDVDRVIFAPGELLALFLWGPGRQTALISAKALHFDPYRQGLEKVLTRYLSWQWRARANTRGYLAPYRVATLLENGQLELDTRHPTRTVQRLEKALDTLREEGIIASWRYDAWDMGTAPARDWAPLWVQTLITIEPPASIPDYYAELMRPETARTRPALSPLASIAERLRETRGRLRLSQADAAEAAGLSQQTYSRAERGGTITPENRQKLEAWLALHALPSE